MINSSEVKEKQVKRKLLEAEKAKTEAKRGKTDTELKREEADSLLLTDRKHSEDAKDELVDAEKNLGQAGGSRRC